MTDRNPDRARSSHFEDGLATWLHSRDAGPAPEWLRLRVAFVAEAAIEPWWRRGRVLERGVALAALGLVVVVVWIALSLRGSIEPLPGSPTQPGSSISPAFSTPGLEIPVGPILALVALASGLALALLVGRAFQQRLRASAQELEPPLGELTAEWFIREPSRPFLTWRRVRRAILRICALLVLVAVVAGVANFTGALRYPGGPLCDGPDCGFPWLHPEGAYGNGMSVPLVVGQRSFDAMTPLVNAGPLPVVVDRITPRVSDRGLVIDGVYVGREPGSDVVPNDLAHPLAAGLLQTLPIQIPPTATGVPHFVVVIFHSATGGFHYYRGVDIEYHVGAATFMLHAGTFVAMCATPLPAGYLCPGKWEAYE